MKLNLGCGEFTLPEYTNVDMYDPRADVVGDMRTLDFSDVEAVNMEHSLEHIPYRHVIPLLKRIHSWMRPGGRIHVEVPDMEEIMARGGSDPLWLVYIYGAQAPHEGEFHCSGFTPAFLEACLREAGFQDIKTTSFISGHPYRLGMPCLFGDAHA